MTDSGVVRWNRVGVSRDKTVVEEGKNKCVAEERESEERAGVEESEEEWRVGDWWEERVWRRSRRGSPAVAIFFDAKCEMNLQEI